MGCGESKHAVATTDSVSTRKGNAVATATTADKKKDNINVTEPSSAAAVAPSLDAGMAIRDVAGNIIQTESAAVAENSEASTGDVKDDEESSNRFEDAADGGVSVEPSEKSMYFLPHHRSKTSSLDSVVTAAEEIKVETENEGKAEEATAEVKEGKTVKEEEKVVEKEDKAVKEEVGVVEAAKREKERM